MRQKIIVKAMQPNAGRPSKPVTKRSMSVIISQESLKVRYFTPVRPNQKKIKAAVIVDQQHDGCGEAVGWYKGRKHPWFVQSRHGVALTL